MRQGKARGVGCVIVTATMLDTPKFSWRARDQVLQVSDVCNKACVSIATAGFQSRLRALGQRRLCLWGRLKESVGAAWNTCQPVPRTVGLERLGHLATVLLQCKAAPLHHLVATRFPRRPPTPACFPWPLNQTLYERACSSSASNEFVVQCTVLNVCNTLCPLPLRRRCTSAPAPTWTSRAG